MRKASEYLENALEHKKYFLTPTAQQYYKEITKDLASGNLKKFDELKMDLQWEVLDIILLYPELFPKAIESFLRDINAKLQTSRSRDGFESILQRTNRSESDAVITERDEKAKGMFGGKK